MKHESKDTIWSIRGVEKHLRDALRDEALNSGKSMGAVLTDILQQHFASEDNKQRDFFAGFEEKLATLAHSGAEDQPVTAYPDFLPRHIGEHESLMESTPASDETSASEELFVSHDVDSGTSEWLDSIPDFHDFKFSDSQFKIAEEEYYIESASPTDNTGATISPDINPPKKILCLPQQNDFFTKTQSPTAHENTQLNTNIDITFTSETPFDIGATMLEHEDSSHANSEKAETQAESAQPKATERKADLGSDASKKMALSNLISRNRIKFVGLLGAVVSVAIGSTLAGHEAGTDPAKVLVQSGIVANKTASTTLPPKEVTSTTPLVSPSEKFALGTKLLKEKSSRRSIERGLSLLLSSADSGHTPASFVVALIGLEQSDDPDVQKRLFRHIVLMARSGHPPAQAFLGTKYLEGKLVARNDALGSAWIAKAALKGDVQAIFTLGMLYSLGRGVTQDLVAAYRLLTVANEAGFGNSQNLLDSIYPIIPPSRLNEIGEL